MVTDRDDGMLLAAVIVAAGLIVGVVAWAGARDRAGVEAVMARSAHPPLVLPEVAPAPVEGDLAWHGWRHDLFWQALAAEPEVEVSSIAIERRPSGEVVVVDPPEVPVQQPGAGIDDWPWPQLRHCESTGRWGAVSPSGRFRGAYQFYQRTWDSVAPDGWRGVDPASAPPEVQHAAAVALQARSGWGQWPQCARRIGLR